MTTGGSRRHRENGADDAVIEWFDGDRNSLRPLFAEADDSASQIERYLNLGRVVVARTGPDIIGHLQVVPRAEQGEIELTSMAVAARRRGSGVGRALVAAAIGRSAADGFSRMLVATATADIGNLRFYQRCGFRFSQVERDAFVPATGYPDPIVIDGIPLLDRIWLTLDL